MNAGTSSNARGSNAPSFLSGAKRVLSLPIVALAGVVFLVAPTSQSAAQEGEEGASAELSDAIAEYLDAQDQLAELQQQQADMEQELADSKVEVDALRVELNDYAFVASTTSDFQSTAALLASGDPQDAIAAMELLQFLGESRADRLNELILRLQEIEATEETLAANIEEQEDVTADLEGARDEAAANSPPAAATTPSARPPRRPPLPNRSRATTAAAPRTTRPPPTVLTPRTLHALEHRASSRRVQPVRLLLPLRPAPASTPRAGPATSPRRDRRFRRATPGARTTTYGQNLAGLAHRELRGTGRSSTSSGTARSGSRGTDGSPIPAPTATPPPDRTNHVHLSMR